MSHKRTVTVPFFISHRGCPHRCVFCDQRAISGSTGVLPESSVIASTIHAYLATANGRPVQAAFFGGSFTMLPFADQTRLLNAVKPFLDAGLITGVRISTRPDAITPDIARRLVTAGVVTVELGVQSLDDAVLFLAERGHTAADVRQAVAILADHGLEVGLQMMPGLPGQTPDMAIAEAEQALSLRPSFLRIYPLLVLRGTKIEARYSAGEYHPWSLDQAVAVCAAMLVRTARANVPVIRLGLQPTEELESPGTIVAGPYHPAFRELVEGELRVRALATVLDRSGGAATVYCSPCELSFFTGHGGRSLSWLQRNGFQSVALRAAAEVLPFTFRLEQAHRTQVVRVLEVQ